MGIPVVLGYIERRRRFAHHQPDDWQDQLLSETRTGYAASYTYDHNGNRLTRTVNGVTETYSYDGTDQLLEITGGADQRTFGYDAQGRTTLIDRAGTANDQVFTYDHESRVTSVTRNGATVSYAYNGLDTRTSVTSGSNTNHFLRDGAYVTDPVLVDSGAQYTPGISERRGTKTTYLHSGLKNAFAQSDTSQQVAAHREYDAFGNVTSSTGTWEGPFGYAGKFGYQSPSIPGVATPDAGITLMGHRYYDSSTGRFLTRDPIFDGRNWYSYGSGEANPITGVDPDGRAVFIIPIVAAILKVGGAGLAAWTVYDIVTDPWNPLNYLPGPFKPLKLLGLAKRAKFGKEGATFSGNSAQSSSSPPNPYDSHGSPAHQDAVQKAGADLEAAYACQGYKLYAGGGKMPERLHPDCKRRPDIWLYNKETGQSIFGQVGKTNKDGSPVAREVDAAGDLSNYGPVFFIPY